MTITLEQVLDFCSTATTGDCAHIINALAGGTTRPNNARAVRNLRNATTLAAISEGEIVKFPYDGVQYEAKVEKINRTTASVKITKITGTPRRTMYVGMGIRVSAGILARV